MYKLELGNSLEVLKSYPDNHFDSVVTDPPYELGFMGKSWDSTGIAFNVNLWKEVLRVLKPGGHIVAFRGSRTYHRMAVAIEDAGFEIRDQIMWVYGSGFPKSHDISKAIDKMEGAEREIIGVSGKSGSNRDCMAGDFKGGEYFSTKPSTLNAQQWDGWGTALKPAHEPIVLARKPLSEKTVAENVLKWGTGGLNIDSCRVGEEKRTTPVNSNDNKKDNTLFNLNSNIQRHREETTQGRWPANFIHDGSEEIVNLFPYTKSGGGDKSKKNVTSLFFGSENLGGYNKTIFDKNEGSASRFFYCAKASKKDRNNGLDSFDKKLQEGANFRPNHMEKALQGEEGNPYGRYTPVANNHPTVKPTDLMAYLCRLITPPNGLILDPFNGSGSTGKGAVRGNFEYVGIDLSLEYLNISKSRIEHEINNK